MKTILIVILLSLSVAKQIKIFFNHSNNAISLFTSKGKRVNFKLSFESQDISLHESFKGQTFYLEKNNKEKLLIEQYAKYDYKVRQGSMEDESMGLIGMHEKNSFFQMLKKSLNMTELKLQIKHKEGLINIINQPCNYPLFVPLQITLSETSTHTFTINSFSMNFYPDSSLLKLIGKEKNPFQISSAAMNNEITLSIRDRIISVPFKDLFTCGRYLNSDSYECQVNMKQNGDVGGLLLYFDPILCESGVELHRSMDDAWGFHQGHVLLLVLQFFILGLLAKEQKVLGMINSFLMRRKNH